MVHRLARRSELLDDPPALSAFPQVMLKMVCNTVRIV